MIQPRVFAHGLLCALLASAASFAVPNSFSQTTVASTNMPSALKAAEASIDPEKIRAHVRFLSDDLLEGRGTGTRGGDIAAKYIATQFALDGLKPGGDNGTYLQHIDFVGINTIGKKTTFDLAPDHGAPMVLRYADDYVTTNQTHTATADVDAPIVFVGYGIDAPEYKWNDYAGVDVRGKVLLVIVSEPPSKDVNFFKGPALTYYGRWTYKFEEAARRGAVGVLIIHRTDLASYGWNVVRNSDTGEKTYLSDDPNAKLKAASWIQLEVARKLFAAAGKNLDEEIDAAGKRGFKAFELPVRLKAHITSEVRNFQSSNVVGILPGTDSGKDQAVLYTAHYDHLGMDPSLPGDKIYNGAADNGTGCGILLELARAWSSSKVRPPHSIIFASVTAEEQGLLGSEYLGMHPPIPAGQMTLDLNYDDVQPFGKPLEVEVSGAERTSFYPAVEKTAQQFDLKIVPDAFPAAGHYYRSDHFSLARVGIPAFSVGEGVLFAGHDREWGIAQEKTYVAERYHQPSDEYRPDMNFTGDAELARFGFALGWKASTSPGLIQWKPGDEFEAARKHSLSVQ
ncbi:MAG: M28 family peptidase [Acidobacteriaceae bacterium]